MRKFLGLVSASVVLATITTASAEEYNIDQNFVEFSRCGVYDADGGGWTYLANVTNVTEYRC
ncbi:MAG: hypothetical protein QNJ97_08555 [Myxococcota bacterium]|nr:hypothetical protein [Myxococcota bacterium]